MKDYPKAVLVFLMLCSIAAVTYVKVSDYQALTTPDEADLFLISRPGVTNYNITAANLRSYMTNGITATVTDLPLSDLSTSGAVSGQVVKFNGVDWAPGTDGGGTGSTSLSNVTYEYWSKPLVLVFHGDSIMAGDSSPSVTPFGSPLTNLWSDATIVVATNLARGGGTVDPSYPFGPTTSDTSGTLYWIRTNYARAIHSFAPTSGTNAILFLEGGINDMRSGGLNQTAAETFEDWTNICASAKYDGFFVVVFTTTYSTAFSTDDNTNRHAFNRLIRQNPQWYDVLIDTAYILDDTTSGVVTTDGTHWSTTTHAAIARYVDTAIRQARVGHPTLWTPMGIPTTSTTTSSSTASGTLVATNGFDLSVSTASESNTWVNLFGRSITTNGGLMVDVTVAGHGDSGTEAAYGSSQKMLFQRYGNDITSTTISSNSVTTDTNVQTEWVESGAQIVLRAKGTNNMNWALMGWTRAISGEVDTNALPAGPSTLTNLVHWWDFTDLGFSSQVDGKFTSIADKGSKGIALEQSNTTNQPTVNTVNSRNVALFSGNQFMTTAAAVDVNSSNTSTIFVVVKPSVYASLKMLFECGDAGGAYSGHFATYLSAANHPYSMTYNEDYNMVTFAGPLAAVDMVSDIIATVDRAQAINETQVYITNSIAATTRDYTNNNSGTLGGHTGYVGARVGTSLFYEGNICEIAIWDRVLTSGERTILNAYAKAKYGY